MFLHFFFIETSYFLYFFGGLSRLRVWFLSRGRYVLYSPQGTQKFELIGKTTIHS